MQADSESELLRKIALPQKTDLPEPDQYQLPDMKGVDLSFAGRVTNASPSLAAIAEAETGDPFRLEWSSGKWTVFDAKSRVPGRMARAWSPHDGSRMVEGKLGAIIRWTKADNEKAFQTYIKRSRWQTILPEIVCRRNSES